MLSSSVIQEIMLDGKSVEITIDYPNERIKYTNFCPNTIIPSIDYLNALAQQQGLGKVIVVAGEEDWQLFLSHGYRLEAINQGYYRGRPGFYLAKYFNIERSLSTSLREEDLILGNVLKRPVEAPISSLPSGYVLRDATRTDIAQLAQLYNNVFSSYPTPICDPDYLAKLIEMYPFKVILQGDTIVCASSAETDPKLKAAELTDCACLPEHRSQGLTSHILQALEQDLIREGFRNLYSIARAKSPGINTLLSKLGYNYGGRLINNCHICGQFENMNLWHKYLEA